jgi:PAS domain S-box-containing protein
MKVMIPARTARRLGRRTSVAVLAVIAVAVAMLGLLVAQTSRHSIDGARMNVAGQQRILSERLVGLTLLSRESTPEQRELWRPRIDATVSELRAASQQLRGVTAGEVVIPPNTPAARDYEELIALQDSVKESASRAADAGATPEQIDSVLAQQKRLAVAIEHVVDELEVEWGHEIDRLLMLEAACVILLLIALVFGTRLALQPTQEQLSATVDALAESESRTRAVLDAMQDGVLLIDDSGKAIAWNPGVLRILGLAPDAAAPEIAEVATRMKSEDGQQIAPDRLPSAVTLSTGESIEGMVVSTSDPAGDRVRWLSVNTNPLYRGDSDVPHAAVCLIRDVTIARQIEEERAAQAQAVDMQNRELLSQADALERSHSLFRSLVETAGSAIVGLDSAGIIFQWNREAESLFGFSRAEALGKEYAEHFVTPEHRDRMRAGIASVLSGQQIRNLVGPVINPNGERHMVLWNITPLRAGPAEPVHGLIAAGLDITEREASDERFRLLFERSTDAHMLYDAEGIVDCNDATLQLLRVDSLDRLVGRRPAELSPLRQPDGRLSVVVAGQMRQRALITGHHRFEWTHRRDDGSEFQVEVTLTPLKLHGRSVLLAVWHDITERKAVEAALRVAKEAAESANRTKSEFVTRMNHELRTPLSAIIGFSRVLLREKSGPLTPEATLYVERIRDNGMHLLSLINQILDVAKVEAGRMELERETVALNALVNETLAMLESTAEAKGLTLRRELPAHVEPLVTDAGKLRQILINIVGNAIKFTAEGEVVVSVTTDADTGQAREIKVRDTGMGIPADRQSKIFEPFEQGDSSTRREYGGTGLGLSIVKTFVKLIGATIEIESEVGVGTTFTVLLPAPRLSGAVTLAVEQGEEAVPGV